MAWNGTRYMDKLIVAQDEFILNDSVFRKIPHHKNYYVSDKAEVMSTHGKHKLLYGVKRSKNCIMYSLKSDKGTLSVKSGITLCAMAFGDEE